MRTISIGFLGCGNIGCGVYRLLGEQGEQIARNEGETFEIRRILVRSKGKKRGAEIPEALMTENPDDVLLDPQISIVMEFMGGEEPAASYMIRALEAGKTVVTANKMALATHWQEILRAAREHAAGLYYEASVCGAIPIIRAINDSLQANRITSVTGIINGTTNYILSRMTREGASYADVLADAQRLGLAEPDPTADVEGYDAAYKLSILSTLAFHRHVPVERVYREGISGITPLDVQCGKAFGLTLKLLAIAKEVDGCIQARVHPAFVPDEHPLASVSDAFNAVYVNGHACGEMMFYGRGAGSLPTASAVVADVVEMAKNPHTTLVTSWSTKKLPLADKGTWVRKFFVRVAENTEEKKAQVEAAFGPVSYIELEGLNEFAFVTPEMAEAEYEKKAASVDGILQMIRMDV